MESKIKISRDLKFDYYDLIRKVDTSSPFTLGDILIICKKSKIPMEILQQLVRCNYIKQYCEEAKKKNDKGSEIEYLEVYWSGTIDKTEGDGNDWLFHGLGKKGVLSEDILEYGTSMTSEEKKNFREKYAIEFSPMYKLAHLPIKVCDEMNILDDSKPYTEKGSVQTIKFEHSITLIELLYAIFWELSFYGSPKERDEKTDELMKRCEEIDILKEKGTLEQNTLSHEEAKAKFEKKFKGKEKR